MLVCGLLVWYHVDCVQFQFYNMNHSPIRDPNGLYFNAMSQILVPKKLGIMIIVNPTTAHDKCSNSVMGHEYQRFQQNRWDVNFCNYRL